MQAVLTHRLFADAEAGEPLSLFLSWDWALDLLGLGLGIELELVLMLIWGLDSEWVEMEK